MRQAGDVDRDVPQSWVLVDPSELHQLEAIRARYQNKDSVPDEDESLYWDWTRDDEAAIDREEGPTTAEKEFIGKVQDRWDKLWRWKPSVSMAEYLAHCSNRPGRPADDGDCAILITVIPPAADDPEIGDQNDEKEDQDPAFLTTTERDIQPTAYDLVTEQEEEDLAGSLTEAEEEEYISYGSDEDSDMSPTTQDGDSIMGDIDEKAILSVYGALDEDELENWGRDLDTRAEVVDTMEMALDTDTDDESV
ncbi:hypothetical protein OE88DRAFT_1085147 [Heliocybe sulcata]|uniref:Uncharacterized protein n=1 Tax=Heliocybe sulcata TaxID=5364 RepID=A0A5C3MKP3_9AGAM|nr:hypothetical protein OE88DRAFT_1085147 [Heliocybe sulcata]